MKTLRLIIICLSLCAASLKTFGVTYVSNRSAAWNVATTWTPNGIPTYLDDVTIASGHIVTNNVDSDCRHLTLDGTLSGGASMRLIIRGNYTLNATGVESGSGGLYFRYAAGVSPGTISGTVTSTFSPTVSYLFYQNTTIAAGTTILKTAITNIQSGIVITNHGTVTIGKVTAFSNCGWINDVGSSLTITKSGFFTGITGATLVADAMNNTVHYNVTDLDNVIYTPTVGFYNLTLSGTPKESFSGSTSILNNFTINSSTPWNINSYSINVGGNLSNSGTLLASTSTINLNGSGAQALQGSSTTTFYNLTKSGSGTTTLGANIIVSHLLTISGGILNAGTYGLSGVGGFTQTNGELQLGKLTGTVPELTGTYSLSGGKVSINGAGSQTIRGATYYYLDILGSGTKTAGGALDVNADLTISSTLHMSASNFALNCAGNFIDNGTFTAQSGTVTFDGITLISGSSIPSFYNVTISGILSAPANMYVLRNWINNGTFTHNSGSIGFNGTSAVSGSSTTTFNNMTINGTLTGHATNMNVAGNWINNGTFTHNNGTVTFNGTSTITGSATNTFKNVTISGSLTAHPSTMNLAGNFVNNGTFAHNSGNVGFTGTSIVSGSSTTTFNNVTISGSLTGHATNMNVAADWVNNGTFTHNNGTVTFNGTSTITGSATNTFKNVTISGSLTAHPSTMNLAGNFVNNGTFAHNNGTVDFTGTSLVSGSSTTTFNNLTISGSLTGHASNMSVYGNWINNNTYAHNNGTITFTGTTAITGSAVTNFKNIVISDALTGHPTSMSVGGNFTNNGAFTHNNGIVNFNGISTIDGSSSDNFYVLSITGVLTAPSTDLYVSSNWFNEGTFNHNGGTVTFNGITIIGGSVTTYFNNITINGALTGHTIDMYIAGDVVNNGTYNSNNGTIILDGTVAQDFSGAGTANYEGFTLNNDDGLTISDGVHNLYGVITINAGLIDNVAGVFLLKSDATRYARIDPISSSCGTCGFAGDFIVERYIPARNIGTWANLSSPVSNAYMSDWDSELFMVYPFTGFDTITNRPTGSNVMAYDEVSASYYQLSSSTPLLPTQGFEIGLMDDASATSFAVTTLNTTGTPNFGTFDTPLSYTAANGPAYPVGYSGENLIGNPYASAIRVGAMTITNALTTVDVYDYTIDNYKTLTSSDMIGPHQGFWMYAQSSGASVLIDETCKTSDVTTNVYRTDAANQHPYLNLKISSADGSNSMAHTLMIATNETALDGWDTSDHPFRKSLNSKAPSITANAGETVLSINTFNNNHETYIMPLNVSVGTDGNYKIDASGLENIISDFPFVLLEDKVLHTFINLNLTKEYAFAAKATDSKQRFTVHFSKSENYQPVSSPFVNNIASQVKILQNKTGNIVNFNLVESENTTISVVDLLGKKIIENTNVNAKNQSVAITLPETFNGMYLIMIEGASGKTVKKFTTLQ